jgi:thioredoxin-dependent peroxiredoxin
MATNRKSQKPQSAGGKPATTHKPASAGAGDAAVLEGMKAPAFELPDQDGNRVSLSQLITNGTVVLYFYPKDMTPGCTTEACGFRDNLSAIRKAGAQVVGISADSPTSHHKFIEKYDLNFRLLSDTENKVSRSYGVFKKKSLYGREFMGIERTSFIIGPDGMVRKVFPRVKVNGHTGEILAALKQHS